MAHTQSGGAAKRTVQVEGKRLGIKKFAGQHVISGNIIVRQHGTRFHAGLNTMLGKDHTIFAVAEGYVSFRNMTGQKRAKKYVDVLPQRKVGLSANATKATKEEKEEISVVNETEAAPAKKAPAKPKAVAKKPTTKKTAK